MTNEEKTYSLSLYLHKDSVENYEECLKVESINDPTLNQYPVDSNKIGADGYVYVLNSEPKKPEWESDINIFSQDDIELEESITNRAVVVLLVDGDYMSITFGYGRFMLNDRSIVSDFGIKVSANLIDSDKIKSLSTMNIEDIVVDIQKQSSVFSSQEQLQINTYQEILKEVAGVPNRRTGDAAPKFLVGTDSLKTTKKDEFRKYP